MEKKKYKLVIIESSFIVTVGLKEIIKVHPEFEIVGSYVDLTHFMERVNTIKCDLILINPTLFSYTKRINVRSFFSALPNANLVALMYTYVDNEVLKQYNNVIQINDDSATIIKRLKQVVESQKDLYSADSDELSDREQEILTSVAKGMTNKEIADLCNISIHTVISHRKNITRKTGIKTVSGLTVYALLNNLIDQSDME